MLSSKTAGALLTSCCLAGNLNHLQLLLDDPGFDPAAFRYRNTRQNALHVASRSFQAKVLVLLLKDGRINPNDQDARGRTPLHYICEGWRETRVACCRLLLEDPRFTEINLLDHDGESALSLAVVRSYGCQGTDLVQLLLGRPDINPWNPPGILREVNRGASCELLLAEILARPTEQARQALVGVGKGEGEGEGMTSSCIVLCNACAAQTPEQVRRVLRCYDACGVGLSARQLSLVVQFIIVRGSSAILAAVLEWYATQRTPAGLQARCRPGCGSELWREKKKKKRPDPQAAGGGLAEPRLLQEDAGCPCWRTCQGPEEGGGE